MDNQTLAAALSQVLALGGFIFWLSKRNADKIDKIQVDIGIVKSILQKTSNDHDKIIVLEQRTNKLASDVNSAFMKLRSIK